MPDKAAELMKIINYVRFNAKSEAGTHPVKLDKVHK
jgi:hypothetical protein